MGFGDFWSRDLHGFQFRFFNSELTTASRLTMLDLDPTTQSNYWEIASEHIAFDWSVDFDAQIISGSATHRMNVLLDGVQEAIFDAGDLEVSGAEVRGSAVPYEVKAKHEVMGSALHVTLPKGLELGTSLDVTVTYKTTKECTALQWLDKEQTQGKQFPYLFSQCQPIYARALAPIQDSPSVKITYSATVACVLPVLLSAIRVSPPSDGPTHNGKVIGKDVVKYTYDQPVPIPSYLIAIACGNVRYRPFPQFEDKLWRTGIWAEPELIDAAYWEFSEDTARFLAAEEKIVTPYKFGVYDLLVLPPSFPYGGMENACLSFLTPTLLTGDRTLVDVVVHELTHSWFGNGVTHAHATHFWLNEGWTVYMERLLLQVLHEPAARGFSYIIGAKALVDDLARYSDKPRYQRLVINMEKGEDPDDSYSRVAYEKGSNLILHLERTLGGLEVFLPYVKEYVNAFIGKSITTEQWKAHLYEYYTRNWGPEKIALLDSVDWQAWLYGEGLKLPVEMEYDTTLAQAAYALADRWDAARATADTSRFKKEDLDTFNANQIIVFLERLQTLPPLPLSHIEHLGTLYKLSGTPNAEIRLRFYALALAPPTSEAAVHFVGDAAKWVVGNDGTGVIKGRMKFCRPIFKAVFKVDSALALEVWAKNKDGFHPIAKRLINKDLGLYE
ncbi:peptidase family M1-domain-containing protein [Mycena belliarum]|uniref:Peptidase family M1-domain-containing protein n=1 Tax=Mycena belliarum TaxID=1033014 RepID=A0AAD6TQD5_9AGAR|nr:peptidase family M1-domain-containing protein [Mycena belliae]